MENAGNWIWNWKILHIKVEGPWKSRSLIVEKSLISYDASVTKSNDFNWKSPCNLKPRSLPAFEITPKNKSSPGKAVEFYGFKNGKPGVDLWMLTLFIGLVSRIFSAIQNFTASCNVMIFSMWFIWNCDMYITCSVYSQQTYCKMSILYTGMVFHLYVLAQKMKTKETNFKFAMSRLLWVIW